jgi:hypothetical protein
MPQLPPLPQCPNSFCFLSFEDGVANSARWQKLLANGFKACGNPRALPGFTAADKSAFPPSPSIRSTSSSPRRCLLGEKGKGTIVRTAVSVARTSCSDSRNLAASGHRAYRVRWEIFKKLGFKYLTLDLEGYRQGSLNEVLSGAVVKRISRRGAESAEKNKVTNHRLEGGSYSDGL